MRMAGRGWSAAVQVRVFVCEDLEADGDNLVGPRSGWIYCPSHVPEIRKAGTIHEAAC